MTRPTHKRSMREAHCTASIVESTEASASSTMAMSDTSSLSTWGLASDQQKQLQHEVYCKRPRLGEYRENDTESDDEKDADENDRNDDGPVGAADSIESSTTLPSMPQEDSSTERRTSGRQPVQRTSSGQLRWILRKESTSPSISSVITEVSEVDIANALTSELDLRANRHFLHDVHLASSSSNVDKLVRNMESWSLTHLRALRRNNVYDAGTSYGTANASMALEDKVQYRQAVYAARRDVMRTLRFSNSTGNSSSGSSISNASACPASSDVIGSTQSSEYKSLRRASTASQNSLKSV